jgi:putative ABC transport system permease protein
MTAIWQDIRFGLRMLRKSPGFTMVAVAALGLGVGANTAIFSVVNAVLLRSLPYHDPQRLVMVWEDASKVGFPRNTPAPGNYSDWKTKIPAFEDVAALDARDFNLTGDGEPEKIGGAGVTSNLFSVLGVKPRLGRVLLPEEDKPGADPVVVVGYGLWVRRFGGDPGLIGRAISLNGKNYTVVGIMPPHFQFPFKEIELWEPAGYSAKDLANRGGHYLFVAARLKNGVTLAQANAQLHTLAERLQRDYPDSNAFTGMYAVPLLDDYVGNTKLALMILLGAVGCVLLIACANMANLLLARATGRKREIAVRTALGAGRGRIIRQLLTENLLLSLAGGTLGLLLAGWSFNVLKNLIPEQLNGVTTLDLDWRVLGFTLAISVVTGILFGLAPAWQVSRTDLNISLKEGGARGGVGGRSGGLRGVLVVAEIAVAMVLLICAGLMIKSFSVLRGLDPGFRPDHVLTLRAVLPRSTYAEFPKRVAFVESVLERVRALPGVKSAGITSALPLVWKGGTSGFWPEGRALEGRGLAYDACNRVISPGYMETMGMKLRQGRFFEARDGANAQLVAMINESMARQYWPGENPLGLRFKFGGPGAPTPWLTIVGIVGDVRMMGLDQPSRPEMYFPVAQAVGNWMWPRDLVIRADGNPMQLTAAIRQAVSSVDKDQPLSNIAMMEEIVDLEVFQRRTQVILLGAFAALALFLACLGIYGVLSYMVTERTAEIGLRLALGAQSGDVLRLIVGRGMILAAGGIVAGLAAAYWATQLLERLLFQVKAHDPAAFAGLSAVLLIVCLLAVYIPARRASRVDPLVAMRYE